MRMGTMKVAGFAGLLLILGGCSDNPTTSNSVSAEPKFECTGSNFGTVYCPGNEPIPPECDFWSDTSCEDEGGDCMAFADAYDSSAIQGCGAGGGGAMPGPGPGGGGGGGGGGTTQPTDPEDPQCNPQYDPDCNQPLTSADSTTLKNGFALNLNTQFTDPAKAEQCRQMKAEFDHLMAAGNVFRGQFDTPENDPHTAVHVGAYDPVSGTMHFEPSTLDAANAGDATAIRNIVNTALHEAAHSLGFDHTDPMWMGSYDVYTEAPFNLLSPGTNSCLTGW
jgi:hypothetical protein